MPVYSYDVVNTYPHDPKAFTQGLVFEDGALYESTGQEGESSLRKVELATGAVLQQQERAVSWLRSVWR
jgi:glutamine cyclotransferase